MENQGRVLPSATIAATRSLANAPAMRPTYSPDPPLNAAQVASELGCSKAHVHHLINGTVAGVPRLPAMRMGRRVVVRRSTLLRWQEAIEGLAPGDTLDGSPNVDAEDASRSN